jgi:hypothetical protein
MMNSSTFGGKTDLLCTRQHTKTHLAAFRPAAASSGQRPQQISRQASSSQRHCSTFTTATSSSSFDTSKPHRQRLLRPSAAAAAVAYAPAAHGPQQAASGHTALLHGLGDVGE